MLRTGLTVLARLMTRYITLLIGLFLLAGLAWFFFVYPHAQRGEAFDNAVFRGDVRTVREMLDKGEPVNGNPNEYEYMSPLEGAAYGGRDDVVSLLLDRGADLFVWSGWGTPLDEAAREGHLSTVRLLVARGILKRDRQARLNFALWGAAVDGRVEVVKYLLKAGADPNQPHPGTGSLLNACRFLGQTAAAPALIAAGARDVPSAPASSGTPGQPR